MIGMILGSNPSESRLLQVSTLLHLTFISIDTGTFNIVTQTYNQTHVLGIAGFSIMGPLSYEASILK